jgi:hypothetical protein
MKSKIQELLLGAKIVLGRQFLLLFVFASIGLGLTAQSLDKAKEFLKAGKLQEAKDEIDKVLAVEKNQKIPENWYYKAKIYDGIAGNEQLKAQNPDAFSTAFAALKKYIELDDKKLLLLQMDQYKPMNEIYQGYFQSGAAEYNAGKYAEALNDFKGAIDAINFMAQKGWVTQHFDTTSTLYAGISAEKAKKRDEAALFYKTIADSGISKIGGNDMIDIYKWLVDYYNTKGEEANTWRYLSLGKGKYPTDLYWYDTELDILRKKGKKDSLWAKYDEVVKQFPDNHLFFFNYGLELYQFASDTTIPKAANYDELIKRSQDNLTKALQIKPDYAQAAMVLGQISFNAGVDLQQQIKTIKGPKPEDVKKRADLRVQVGKKFDEAIPYFEKVDQDLGSKGKLKMDDKNVLKDAYDLLITIYEQKNIKEKIDSYTAKFNNVDKDH